MNHLLIKYRKATPADFDGILQLQHKNLRSTLKDLDLSQGFLSIESTREQLREISDDLGIYVAVQGDEVIGYLMAESSAFATGSPLIAYMLKRLRNVIHDGAPLSARKWFVYGPVCIDTQYRGRKILEELFRAMLTALRGKYEVGVAFVSMQNPRSFNAHKNKLGMQIADEFEFNGQRYWSLVFTVI